jgi:hypothetical protein
VKEPPPSSPHFNTFWDIPLAKLMVDHHIGVSAVRAYETSRIDSDYFAEE